MDSFDQEVANMFYSVQQITKKKSVGEMHPHSKPKPALPGTQANSTQVGYNLVKNAPKQQER